jgi:hypothetical protein
MVTNRKMAGLAALRRGLHWRAKTGDAVNVSAMNWLALQIMSGGLKRSIRWPNELKLLDKPDN